MQLETHVPSNAVTEVSRAQELPPQMAMLQMITGYWVAQSIYAAAKLGIADLLTTGARSCEELADSTKAYSPALFRLLRALASVGIFAETKPGWFTLTPLAEFLRSDISGSLRDVSIMMGDPEHYSSWGNIMHSLMTGKSAFEDLYLMNAFQYFSQNPVPAAIFDRAMTSFSGVENDAVVAAYDFSTMRHIVDVAGGHGSLLTTILQANPHVKGTLFDLPDVIARAKPLIDKHTVSDRCQLISGSFFESVPPEADAYLFKHIIHDWDDERSIAILKTCHQAMPENSKLLVIETVIPPGNAPSVGKLLDINMLVMCPGGKERTEAEYQQLFAAAGFKLTRVISTNSVVAIVEGMPIK